MPRPLRDALSYCFVVGWALWSAAAIARGEEPADRYLRAVEVFADKVLAHGRDTYGPKRTPLFVDALNVDTLEPGQWVRKGQTWILSNLASQQNLCRVLDGLSISTGDPRYRRAAIDAIAYTFAHLQDRGGLLRWGGHTCYDALGDRVVSEANQHEMKHHYPYYALMWQVDARATRRLLEGIWDAHVVGWDILDFNRHGRFGRAEPGDVWDRSYEGGPVPFTGKGLTFMMSGTDLIYAGACLARLSGDQRPLTWAKRLARRYVEARHPETGLGASNFSVLPDRRMQKQFPQFEGRFSEATVTDIYGARYTYCAICQLRLGEMLGPQGREFLQWGLEDLTARAKHGYDDATHSFRCTLIDGTQLSPADRKKDGYVTVRWLQPRPVSGRYFLAYALAYKLSGDPLMWRMTRSIGHGLGLGDLGERPGQPGTLATTVSGQVPLILFGLLELHEATGTPGYLDLAQRIADQALRVRVHNGLFVESQDHLFARLDDPLPLALLHLRAALLGLPPDRCMANGQVGATGGLPTRVLATGGQATSATPSSAANIRGASANKRPPVYWGGQGYFHCPHDGAGRTYDKFIIYPRLRSDGQRPQRAPSAVRRSTETESPGSEVRSATRPAAATGKRAATGLHDERIFQRTLRRICDLAATELNKQLTPFVDRADANPATHHMPFFEDAHAVRALAAVYDMTGNRTYLAACQRWSDRMVEYQSRMIPAGAYYMNKGRAPGQDHGQWNVADSGSIAMGVLATAVRCQDPARKARYLNSVEAFAKLVMDNYVAEDGGVSNGLWPAYSGPWWCSTATFGSLAFLLHNETGAETYLRVARGALDWMTRRDFREVQPITFAQRPSGVIFYCFELYALGLTQMQPGSPQYDVAIGQIDLALAWMGKSQKTRGARVPDYLERNTDMAGLPYLMYVFARELPQHQNLTVAADKELAYISQLLLGEGDPNVSRLLVWEVTTWAMLSYAERLMPGAMQRGSHWSVGQDRAHD